VADSQLDSLVAVLDEIRGRHAKTRPELIERTGLTRAIVAQRVQELIDHGLVEEGETGESSGGRAPRLLRFRAEAGQLLVADLGATGARVALTDLSGTIVSQKRVAISIADGAERVLGEVDTLFDELYSAADTAGPLWGIGVGVPGPVQFSTGRPVSPPIMPGWDSFPIREHFARYDVPVWVDNDVNVMALGELRAGLARNHRTVVYVKIGTGIGAGLIVDGHLHRGAEGSAGDVGHIAVTDDPSVVCRCGKIGCLEALAGGGAIARAAEAAALDGRSGVLAQALAEHGSLSAKDVGWGATHGDQTSVELIGQAGRLVGGMVATLVNVLNPSLIVIGGGVSRVGDLLLATIRQSVYGRSLPLATRSLSIQRTSLGDRCGVIGAASMVADELFSRELLGTWLPAGHPVGMPELAAASR
jgi:glucokinase-like ROK family protein